MHETRQAVFHRKQVLQNSSLNFIFCLWNTYYRYKQITIRINKSTPVKIQAERPHITKGRLSRTASNFMSKTSHCERVTILICFMLDIRCVLLSGPVNGWLVSHSFPNMDFQNVIWFNTTMKSPITRKMCFCMIKIFFDVQYIGFFVSFSDGV
jgi:hypothetical protein